jgi:hypothetical protein
LTGGCRDGRGSRSWFADPILRQNWLNLSSAYALRIWSNGRTTMATANLPDDIEALKPDFNLPVRVEQLFAVSF